MIIKKDGTFSKVLKEILKGNKTGNVSTLLNEILFEKNKGIILILTEGINSLLIKDENIDFNAKVPNSFIVTALASELEKDDVSISIIDSNITFNGYTFETISLDDTYEGEVSNNKISPFIFFKQEQFRNLEKDFELTIGNYFKLSKATDVICFAFNEGKLYKLLPGCNVYEISKFDAVIDEIELEKNFGHSTCIYIMPHKIFDIMKNEQNITISYNNGCFYFAGSEIVLTSRYGNNSLKTNVFINNLSIINKDSENIATLKDFLPLKEYIKNISSNLFEEAETPNIFINIEDGKLKINIEDVLRSFDTNLKNNITFDVNLLAFNYILQNLPEDTMISKSNYYLVFKAKDKTIFIINKEL